MAQTRKRRRSKHRGNAAGVVEARGRTGRKVRPDERRPDPRTQARERRLSRLDRPPTWRSAMNRAAIGAVILFALGILLFDQTVAEAAVLMPFLFAFYVPLGYYTDLWLFRRRQRGRAKGAGR